MDSSRKIRLDPEIVSSYWWLRIVRGGRQGSMGELCRAAYRNNRVAMSADPDSGFRLTLADDTDQLDSSARIDTPADPR